MRIKWVFAKNTLLNMLMLISTMLILTFTVDSARAANIVGIAMGYGDLPFLLDDEGQVWAFTKSIRIGESPVKLPNLKHIKKIAPFIAIDSDGMVFTWAAKVGSNADGVLEAVYTIPKKVENLQNVTLVASSSDRFFAAVSDNKGIFVWEAQWVGKTGDISNEPVNKVASLEGIKAIAVNHKPAFISKTGDVVRETSKTIVALFDDGAVIGWGIDPSGTPNSGDFRQETLLAKLPGATEVAINAAHIAVLSLNGLPKFWGVCGRNSATSEKTGASRRVMGADGYINDVTAMFLDDGDDNIRKNVFIKRDGSAWAANAPAPDGLSTPFCPQASAREKSWKITNETIIAVQAAIGSTEILILDSNHDLWWTSENQYIYRKLTKVKINLQ